MRSKVVSKKVGVELNQRGELNKRSWDCRLASWGSIDKNDSLHIFSNKKEDITTQTSSPVGSVLLAQPLQQQGPMERRTR